MAFDNGSPQPISLAGLSGMTPPQPGPFPPTPQTPQTAQIPSHQLESPHGPQPSDEWMGRYQRTPWRQPYQPDMPRPYGQWGQRGWALQGMDNYPGTELPPGMPSFTEGLGLIQNSGRFLGRFGPGGIAQNALQASGLAGMLQQYAPLLDLVSKGQFSKNMIATQEARLRLMQDQMQIKADLAVNESNELLQRFSRIYDTWALGGYGTPGTAEADQAAEDAADALAVKDPNIHAILKSTGMKGVEQYLTHLDNQVQTMAAGVSATRKSSKGGGQSAYSGDSAGEGGISYPDEARFKKPDVTTGTPADDPALTALKGGKYDDYIKNAHRDPQGRPLNDAGLAAARAGLVNPQEIDKGDPSSKAVYAASTAMRSDMNKIAARPVDPEQLAGLSLEKRRDVRTADQEEKLAELEKIAPEIATTTRSVLSYQTPLSGLNTQERGLIRSLAHQIAPRTPDGGGFDEQKYVAISEFYKPNSNVNRVATKSGELLQGVRNSIHAVNLTLDALGGRDVQKIPQRVIDKWLQNKWSGEPEYDNLYGAMQGMMNQFASVISLTGTPRVSTVANLLKEAGPERSPRQLMMQFANDVANAWKVADSYQSQWMQLTGRNTLMPGMKRSDWEAYMALSRMNWETGEMPSDAPPEWRAVGRDPAKASAGIPANRRGRPLTLPQLRELKDHIGRLRANKDDPDQQRQADDLSRYLPNFLDAATEVPDLD